MLRCKSSTSRKTRTPVEGLFCQYPHRQCMQNRLDGYDFCMRHILEDKTSNFKQCGYMSNKSGKRCTNAIQRSDKKEKYVAFLLYYYTRVISNAVMVMLSVTAFFIPERLLLFAIRLQKDVDRRLHLKRC